MKLILNAEQYADEIRQCIEKHGFSPEHNFTYFLTTAEGAQNIFLKSDDGYGVMANYRENVGEVVMISEALAPKQKQVKVLHDALMECFQQLRIKKFVVEQNQELRAATLKSLKEKAYSTLKPRYELYWPVFDMRKWDGDKMSGEEWKKLRNIKNRFYKEHNVEVVDSSSVNAVVLKKIVNDWVQRRKLLSAEAERKDSNLAYYDRYIKMIDFGFAETKFAKTLVVDGQPCTITTGWNMPNSDSSYYSAMGLSNFAFENLAEIANLDDLCRLKQAGYKLVDFGGSPKPLLDFKMKFRPHTVYRTTTYAIVKKN